MDKKIPLSKKDFVEAIADVKQVNQYYEEKNKLYEKNGIDGYLYEPECCATVIKLLHLMFGDLDADNEIATFCFTGNFGKKKKECLFVDDKKKEHEIKDAETLYDYLISKECLS